MPTGFHNEPFDEGTLTKLELFQRYAEAWLPVFVARHELIWPEVNIFDFFAGAGTDSAGVEGSALRLLRVIEGQQRHLSRPGLRVSLRLSDAHAGKVEQLRRTLAARKREGLPVRIEVERADFAHRFASVRDELARRTSANLLIIDQFGVKEVPDDMFEQIIRLETTDVLFFISSATFRRFHNVPEVARLTLPGYQRPGDHYRAHMAVADAYRRLVPAGKRYHVASFSIKKGSNVYGVIFGSKHPLGMDKFLEVAWDKNKVTGDADFDVYREGIEPAAPSLFAKMNVPTKVKLFEQELERELLRGICRDEAQVIEICHRRGVRRKHAEPVLKKLKQAKRIECGFRVPDIDRWKTPRPIELLIFPQ
jgi:three-Cys-motif partner protein